MTRYSTEVDIQTWIETEDPEEAKKRDYDALSAVFDTDFIASLMENGVRTVGHQGDTLLLQDTITGLPYIYRQSQMRLDLTRMFSAQYDVIDACFYRQFLREGDYHGKGKVLFSTLFTQSALDRYGIDSLHFLDQPIVDYYVHSKEELVQTVRDIQERLSGGPYFRKLWFRGQRAEYTVERDPQVCSLLGIGKSGAQSPSLLPSLGRYVHSYRGEIALRYALGGSNHAWEKPFIIWFIRNNPQWLDHYPEFVDRLEGALRSADDRDFAKLLGEIRFDPNVPTEVDDLRQWFYAHYRYSTWVLVLQQYGYMTSMLDVTWDLETAIFFTHSRMVDNRFEFVQPTKNRVIYVLAESKESTSFVDSMHFDWGDEDWVRDVPSRIQSQRCGALFGSRRTCQNVYGQLVVARIHLEDDGITSERTLDEVFPPTTKDLLYRTLLEADPRPHGLY